MLLSTYPEPLWEQTVQDQALRCPPHVQACLKGSLDGLTHVAILWSIGCWCDASNVYFVPLDALPVGCSHEEQLLQGCLLQVLSMRSGNKLFSGLRQIVRLCANPSVSESAWGLTSAALGTLAHRALDLMFSSGDWICTCTLASYSTNIVRGTKCL